MDLELQNEIQKNISAILSSTWVPTRGKGQKMPPPSFAEEVKEPPQKRTKRVTSRCQPPWRSLIESSSKWRQRYETKGPDTLDQICVRECGAGGDCLFYAVAIGYHLWENPDLSTQQIAQQSQEWMLEARKWAASGVTPNQIEAILKKYQKEWFEDYVWRTKIGRQAPWNRWPPYPETWKPYIWGGTFSYTFHNTQDVPEEWQLKTETKTFVAPDKAIQFLDPTRDDFKLSRRAQNTMPANLTPEEQAAYSVKVFKTTAFQEVIKTAGEKFRGEGETLEWMTQGNNPIQANKIGFIILSDLGHVTCEFYPVNPIMDYYMILYNQNHYHWQLAGISQNENNPPRSVFRATEIPQVLQTVWVQDCIIRRQDHINLPQNHPMLLQAQDMFP
jgi:hypothetical protein